MEYIPGSISSYKTNGKLKVLVACEYSGTVRDAFAKLGHTAVSCDLLDSKVADGLHYTGDVFKIINDGWDIMIAHPPCTHLANSGAQWFPFKQKEQSESIDFVKRLFDADIKHIAIENPVGVLSTHIRKPDQIVHPYHFGDSFKKRTCLWLKNLPLLQHTNVVDQGKMQVTKSGKVIPEWYSNAKKSERWMIRSTTFPGFAQAMADQWSKFCMKS